MKISRQWYTDKLQVGYAVQPLISISAKTSTFQLMQSVYYVSSKLVEMSPIITVTGSQTV